MLKINFIAFCFLFTHTFLSFSQSAFVPYNPDYYHLLDRYEIKSGRFSSNYYTSFKPTLRSDIASFTDSLSTLQNLSQVDHFNINYLRNDNWEWFEDSLNIGYTSRPRRFLFSRNNAMYSYKDKNFEVLINPVINFEQSTYNKKYFMSLNTRGFEIRGAIAKKIGFYTFITDNQAFFPDYVNSYIDSNTALPNEGFHKTFKKGGYDFFSARGYITFNIVKFINVQFGHDKNFIGNGYRSLMLSDFSSKYLFLKLTTKVWRFNYTNLFTQMTAFNYGFNAYNPRKYMTMHHLSFNFSKNFNMGLFEAVSFRRDSLGGGFDLNYLNPVIFYREIESYLGSEDKAEVGLDLKWNFANHFSVYGQFVLNEFVARNLAKQNGWWGNKYAWQVGLKYIDVAGIKNFDIQLEHNFVRPYVYADKNALNGFSNYNQPIAHPLGANFYEFIGIARLQPMPRLTLTAKAFYWVIGKDINGENYGSNVMKSYNTRPKNREFGNVVGQGLRTNVVMLNFNASYMLFHNFFIDLRAIIRREQNSLFSQNNNFITAGIRWNIGQRLQEF